MRSYKDQLLHYAKSWQRSIYSLNTQGARYYGATFYKRNAWDGEHIYQSELDEKMDQYDYIIDLSTMSFIKSN